MESVGAAVAVVFAAGVVAATVLRLSERSPFGPPRDRLIGGIPWGSLLTIGVVLLVYLGVQRGVWQWSNPLVLPFRSWSYFYPTGVLVSGFAHASPSHLIGNLTATAVLAPIAEYAWGHYPDGDGGRHVARSDPWHQRPWIRAFVIVPGAGLAVGTVTAIFALGPVIGFSGVVFAYGGFALVHYPITTVMGLFGVSVLRILLDAIRNPVTVAGVQTGTPTPPGWATIAVQSHGLGFLIGFLLGVAVLRRRQRTLTAWRVGVALVIYGLTRGLWQVYRVAGNDVYVLYRAGGVVLVLLLAAVGIVAVAGDDRPVPIGGTRMWADVGTIILVLVTALLVGMAIPFGLVTIDTTASGGAEETLSVEDYTITYTEGTTHQLVPAVDIGPLGELTEIETSGLIVYSEQRQLWSRTTSQRQLEARGETTLVLGGLTWTEPVTANRTGWDVAGNKTVYVVDLTNDDRTQRVRVVNRSQARPVIDNRTVTVFLDETGQFAVAVETKTGETLRTPMPAVNESTTVGGLTVTVEAIEDQQTLVVKRHGTRVEVATRSR